MRKNIVAARLVMECLSCGDEQFFGSDWDETFVQDLAVLARRLGDELTLSDKQWDQLFRIAAGFGVEL